MRAKEESEKAGLKLNIQKLRSQHPVPSLHGKSKGKKWKQWQILFSWAPKSLQTSNCSCEIKRRLLLVRKAMTNLDSVLKSRDITLSTNVCIVKAMVFPVVIYRCDSWIIKKAGCQRTDAFELWCWRRLLRIPWTVRRSNQSILKEINPDWKDWCRSWNSNILVTWYEELTHCKRSWNWERLRAGGEGGVRRWDGWMASVTQWSRVWVSSHSSVLAWRVPGMGEPCGLPSMGSYRVRHDWSDLVAAAAARI